MMEGLVLGADAVNGMDASVVTSAVQGAVTNTLTMMAGLLPIALTVFAATWGVRKAIRFFKGTAN